MGDGAGMGDKIKPATGDGAGVDMIKYPHVPAKHYYKRVVFESCSHINFVYYFIRHQLSIFMKTTPKYI